MEAPSTPIDRKDFRITIRITDADLALLQADARKQGSTVGAALRQLIRELLPKK